MKKPTPVRSKSFSASTVHVPAPDWKKHHRRPKGTIVAVGLLIVFHLVVLFMFTQPDRRLPMLLQRLVGLADAALAAAAVMIAVNEIGKKFKKFTYFKGHKASTGLVGGAATFALFFGLWFTPMTPIKVGVPAADDLVNLFGGEVMVVTLSLADPLLAIIEVPAAPPQAIAAARDIPIDDRPFAQAMKAIAESRFTDGQRLLEQIEKTGEVEPKKWHLARGQLELFAGRCWNAPPWFEQAVADAPTDLDVLCQAASSWAVAGNYAKAAEVGQTLLERAESGGAASANLVPMAYNLLAAVKICQGHFQEADAFSQKCQSIVERAGAADHWPQAFTHIAASRNNLAVMYAMHPSKYAGAESQFKSADDAWRQAEREPNSRQATGQASLATLYLVEAKYALAKHTFAEAIEQQHRVLPPKHPNLAVTMVGQGMLEYTLGHYAESARLAEEADKLLDERLKLQKAVTLRLRGLLDLAEGHYTWGNGDIGTAAKLAHDLLPPDHPFFAALMAVGAQLDVARGDFAQADQTCKQAVDLISLRLGKLHPELAGIEDTWGQACSLQKNGRGDAHKHYSQALAVLNAMEKDTKAKSTEAARAMAGLASLARKTSWREATTDLRKAITLDNTVLAPLAPPPTPEAPGPPPPHPDVAGYNQLLGYLYTNLGSGEADLDQAAACYQQALAQRESQLQPNHPEIAAVLEEYAALLSKRGEDEQAAAMEKRAKLIRAKIKSEGDIQPDRPAPAKEPAAEAEK